MYKNMQQMYQAESRRRIIIFFCCCNPNFDKNIKNYNILLMYISCNYVGNFLSFNIKKFVKENDAMSTAELKSFYQETIKTIVSCIPWRHSRLYASHTMRVNFLCSTKERWIFVSNFASIVGKRACVTMVQPVTSIRWDKTNRYCK